MVESKHKGFWGCGVWISYIRIVYEIEKVKDEKDK